MCKKKMGNRRSFWTKTVTIESMRIGTIELKGTTLQHKIGRGRGT